MFYNFNVVSAGAETFSSLPRPHTHTIYRGAGLTTPQLFLSRRKTFSTLALSLNLFLLRSLPPLLLSSSNLRLRVTFFSLTAVLRFDGGDWAQPLGPREIEFQFFFLLSVISSHFASTLPMFMLEQSSMSKATTSFIYSVFNFFPLLAISRTSGAIGGDKKKITDFDRLLLCRSS